MTISCASGIFVTPMRTTCIPATLCGVSDAVETLNENFSD